MTARPRRVAMLSLHTSPLAPLGGRESGGMNVYVREVARELAAAGVAVDVFTRRTDPVAPELQPLGSGARLVQIDAGPPARIEKEELRPYTGAFADGVEAFARREDARYDVVHSHYWLSAEAGDELAARLRVPHVAMFHTLADAKQRAHAAEEPAARVDAERRLVHAVDCVVAASEHERDLLRSWYRVPAQRVAVIPLGVDLECFRPRDRTEARRVLGLSEDVRTLLAVGRIEPLKGFDLAIRALAAMREHERTQLLIAGGDERAAPELARLRAVAEESGVLDAVRFVGAVPHERLHTYYNAADVVVMPSLYESFGLVAVEAMASGVPVVASRVGGLSATVEDGETGYLVRWRDPREFAARLDALLADDALRARLGRNAAHAMRAYAWEAVASDLLDLYGALLAPRVEAVAAGGA